MKVAFPSDLVDRIGARMSDTILRVGIDGVDGAGKTTLADALADVLRTKGLRVIRAGVDGFHNERAVRYRLGRDSPEGFYRDTTNIALLREALLDPLAPGGGGRYRVRAFDHVADRPVDEPWMTAEPPAVLLFDGIFLHRPELRGDFDLTVFLDVPFAESYRRMAARDGSDPDPKATANRRYYEGQRLYLEECRPQEAAHIVVDYADLDAPKIVRG